MKLFVDYERINSIFFFFTMHMLNNLLLDMETGSHLVTCPKIKYEMNGVPCWRLSMQMQLVILVPA